MVPLRRNRRRLGSPVTSIRARCEPWHLTFYSVSHARSPLRSPPMNRPVDSLQPLPRGDQPGGRHRRALTISVAVALVGLAIAAVVLMPSSSPPNTSGRPAPDFDLENLDPTLGRIVLADYRGRPVVINFWASWCVPCREEMPAFERVHERAGDRIAFLGVDHQDTRPEALAFQAETKVSYPSGFDPSGKTATAYELYGLPSTVFVSADGRILDQHLGRYSEADLQAELDRLFPPSA